MTLRSQATRSRRFESRRRKSLPPPERVGGAASRLPRGSSGGQLERRVFRVFLHNRGCLAGVGRQERDNSRRERRCTRRRVVRAGIRGLRPGRGCRRRAAASWCERWRVRIALARPSAVPSCWPVFKSPAARPALSWSTPAFAAVVRPVKTPPMPMDDGQEAGQDVRDIASRRPGSRDSQYSPAAAMTVPDTITGFVPMRANSCDEMPAAMMNPPVSGR